MPYALIPEGFTLKKVTKAQEKAVKDKRRHDDVIAILNNPETITLIAGIISGGLLIQQLKGLDIPEIPNYEDVVAKIDAKINPVTIVKSKTEAIPTGITSALKDVTSAFLQREQDK
jgi:hypothetical protein